MKTFYSTDDEMFNFEFGELIEHLQGEHENSVGVEYYSCEFKLANLKDYIKADWILESTDEYLYDDIRNDDGWDIFSSVSKEAEEEFDEFISTWIDKHLNKHQLYKPVGKSVKHVITNEDLE